MGWLACRSVSVGLHPNTGLMYVNNKETLAITLVFRPNIPLDFNNGAKIKNLFLMSLHRDISQLFTFNISVVHNNLESTTFLMTGLVISCTLNEMRGLPRSHTKQLETCL